MLSQRSAILVQNAAGLGLMLHAASGRTQPKPETRTILRQNRRNLLLLAYPARR